MSRKTKNLWNKMEPADLLAVLLVIGVIGSNWLSVTSQFMVPQALLLIIGAYFGHRITKDKNI